MMSLKRVFFLYSLLFFVSWGMAQATLRPISEAKGIPVGTQVLPFFAKNANDSLVNLSDYMAKGNTVVIFVRGIWCPICNKHLSRIQDSLSFILERGTNVLVISPEKPEYSKRLASKTGATFDILYDEGYKISDAFDVTFLPEKSMRVLLNSMANAKLKESHSDDSERLPIPATFILSRDGVVLWRHFNPDYKVRASVKQILENLPE
jgi:peroxiredoxin